MGSITSNIDMFCSRCPTLVSLAGHDAIRKIIHHYCGGVFTVMWRRDQSQCCKCGGSHNLNINHIQPVAVRGSDAIENLRLLCFSCNQRQAIKTFGLVAIER